MRKIITAAVISAALIVGVSACSSASDTPSKQSATHAAARSTPPAKLANLAGDWKQSNPADPDSYQAATITDSTITIYWVSNGGDTKSLYWAGSYVPPTQPGSFTWDSANDTSQTADALLASSDPTKTFTYADGVISYSASILGTTTTVKLTPQQ